MSNVTITTQIREKRRDFITKHHISPEHLFLGWGTWQDFMVEHNNQNIDGEGRFMGMKITQVQTEHHIDMA